MKLSIILPVFNEEESVEKLYQELNAQLAHALYSYEIIAVNDGSRDGSAATLEKIAAKDKRFKVLHLSKNYGQTAALSAGFDAAQGEVLIPMDADLQNDPADIPKFLKKVDEGYDVVAGWRKDRKDNLVRRLPSFLANKLISRTTGIVLHDYGCTMKAFRKEILSNVRFYGEMHRFIPLYVAWQGARIAEMVVNHRPRLHGTPKYGKLGLGRTFRVMLDLVTAKFLFTYLAKPMHFFGSVGLVSLLLGFLSGIWAIILRIDGLHLNQTPLPLLTAFFALAGTQFILMGVLAEILIRIYHEPRGRATYSVRTKTNFDHAKS